MSHERMQPQPALSLFLRIPHGKVLRRIHRSFLVDEEASRGCLDLGIKVDGKDYRLLSPEGPAANVREKREKLRVLLPELTVIEKKIGGAEPRCLLSHVLLRDRVRDETARAEDHSLIDETLDTPEPVAQLHGKILLRCYRIDELSRSDSMRASRKKTASGD